ncbi:MAG: hypothetical protein AVDCRST_MAG88-4108, partial [uncultured Thermomicrobiales bacterium]
AWPTDRSGAWRRAPGRPNLSDFIPGYTRGAGGRARVHRRGTM